MFGRLGSRFPVTAFCAGSRAEFRGPSAVQVLKRNVRA